MEDGPSHTLLRMGLETYSDSPPKTHTHAHKDMLFADCIIPSPFFSFPLLVASRRAGCGVCAPYEQRGGPRAGSLRHEPNNAAVRKGGKNKDPCRLFLLFCSPFLPLRSAHLFCSVCQKVHEGAGSGAGAGRARRHGAGEAKTNNNNNKHRHKNTNTQQHALQERKNTQTVPKVETRLSFAIALCPPPLVFVHLQPSLSL